MKKKIAVLLCVVMCVIITCACADGKTKKNPEILQSKTNVTEAENTPASKEADTEGIFILRNATKNDIYSLEFSSSDKENLLIDAVLPAGNEVKIKNSGVWEIKAEFMEDDGSYYQESFGEADLNYKGVESVIILSENEQGYYIETEQ